MATLIGRGYIFGLATLSFGITSLSGYVSPKVDTLALSHNADFTEEMDQTGLIDAVIGNPRGVTCQFRFKPRSQSGAPNGGTNDVAHALKAAGIPQVAAGVTINGLQIIAFGGFTDVFNTDAGNQQPWIYDGSGSLEGSNDGLWTGVLTLRRYIGITNATAIV